MPYTINRLPEALGFGMAVPMLERLARGAITGFGMNIHCKSQEEVMAAFEPALTGAGFTLDGNDGAGFYSGENDEPPKDVSSPA